MDEAERRMIQRAERSLTALIADMRKEKDIPRIWTSELFQVALTLREALE